jgi:hypothetical protein
MVLFMSKFNVMSKLGKVFGSVTKASKKAYKTTTLVLESAKLDFVKGYQLGIAIGNEDQETFDTVSATIIKPTVVIKCGVVVGRVVTFLKGLLQKMREWYKNKLTVVTEGTEEEHAKCVSDRISHITSMVTHGLCISMSALFFGFAHWFTLSLCASAVYSLYVG